VPYANPPAPFNSSEVTASLPNEFQMFMLFTHHHVAAHLYFHCGTQACCRSICAGRKSFRFTLWSHKFMH